MLLYDTYVDCFVPRVSFLWGLDICSPVIVFSFFFFLCYLLDENFDVYGKAGYWLLYLPYISLLCSVRFARTALLCHGSSFPCYFFVALHTSWK